MDWCLKSLSDSKGRLLSKGTNLIVADAAFSGHPFVSGLKQMCFFIVSRLRKDAALYYPAEPKKDNSVGRPPMKGDRLDPKALDYIKVREMTVEGWAKAYDLLVWCTSLKSKIRLAICYDDEGNHKYFFSNDLTLSGEEIMKLYHVSRSSFAFAMHTNLPALETVRHARKRSWASHSMCRCSPSTQRRS